MLYESELRRLADEFAQERVIHDRRRPLSPWFDADCRSIRRTCRKLERRYRRSKTNADRQAWVDALHKKHADFEAKKTEYWTRLWDVRYTTIHSWVGTLDYWRREVGSAGGTMGGAAAECLP